MTIMSIDMLDCMMPREEVYRTMGDLIPFRVVPTRPYRIPLSWVADTKEPDKVLSAQIIFFPGVRYQSFENEKLDAASSECLSCRERPVRQG